MLEGVGYAYGGDSMAGLKRCRSCGVPLMVGRGQLWKSDGTIVESRDPEHRMLFCESDNLDALFGGIEEIIGMPIGKIVVESKRRVTKEYMEKLIPAWVRKFLYVVGPKMITRRITDIGRAYGYGNIELVEYRRRFGDADYLLLAVNNPYSLHLFQGDSMGGLEAATGRECTAEVKRDAEGRYLVEVKVGTHPPELQERLKARRYPLKPGNIRLERCGGCGVPLEIARYRWDLARGTITDPRTGMRMAIFGPAGLEAIFDDLEAELGDAVPATIIEAERRYVKDHLDHQEWLRGEEALRHMMALRGLGILSEYKAHNGSFTATISNACVPHLMVGIVQGLFEMATGSDSTTYQWSRAEDGDLTITINAT